ncbi:hypothetical protein LBMAG21_03830 [Armatimonadota bacterium]|nr:hypothetical protein LBMAG21_03830 [Armatimonadota bacterium]
MRAKHTVQQNMRPFRTLLLMSGATLALFAATGCHIDMWRQPKVRGQQESTFFADQSSMRLPVHGTIAQGQDKQNEPLETGYEDGPDGKKRYVKTIPPPIVVTPELLKRGQERYAIFCTPCHGKLGDGKGMIAQRGFSLRRPPGNYHSDRLRKMPIGHFYDVITNGYGAMFSYASRIQDTKDRWAIVAYVRVLQKSQGATVNDVPEEDKAKLEMESAKPAGEANKTSPLGSEGH